MGFFDDFDDLKTGTLFYGDNLPILRDHVPDESVDLIYLDPPFNSNRNYSVLFRDESGRESEAQIQAFEDTWHWSEAAEQAYYELWTTAPDELSRAVVALRGLIGTNQVMAYLVMMAARLAELHRVLKPAGSIYLHCDPTASHYLKIVMDAIFGPTRFKNEIVWQRTSAHNDPSRYGRVHDVLLFYTKGKTYKWNQQFEAQNERYFGSHDFEKDENGKLFRKRDLTAPGHGDNSGQYDWKGRRPPAGRMWSYTKENMERLEAEGRIAYTRTGMPRLKMYLEDLRGVPLQDVWANPGLWLNSGSKERLGYPTQKPVSLLERIVKTSSDPGDVVLDPFCGCGTATAAAQKLGRKWIGIDITHLSIALQKYRLEAMFPGIEIEVKGEPEDLGAARQLASDDRYQFQWWALSLIRAKPLGGGGGKTGRKGADKGIDGVINFFESSSRSAKPHRALIQVKSGKVGSRDIRDLRGTVEREKASLGVFITLEEPTRPMKNEALDAGFYDSPGWGQRYPRIQILTIRELLAGAGVKMPPQHGTFKEARTAGDRHEQLELG